MLLSNFHSNPKGGYYFEPWMKVPSSPEGLNTFAQLTHIRSVGIKTKMQAWGRLGGSVS